MRKVLVYIILLAILGGTVCYCCFMETSSTFILNPNLDFITLKVYHKDDTCIVTISQQGSLLKYAEYTSNRELKRAFNLTPVELNEIEFLLGRDLNEIETTFGTVHADVGSGFYIPTYITVDGYAVSLGLENETVISVSKTDLFSGATVEFTSNTD